MPVYEFHCPACQKVYETRVERMGEVAPCPECGSTSVTRLMSASAVHAKSAPSPMASSPCAAGACGIPPCASGTCPLG